MFKKLSLLVVASLACVSLMAAPANAQKVQKESRFAWLKSVEQQAPTKAPAVVPQPQRERSTVEPRPLRSVQNQQKSLFKAPVVSNDTIFITEQDLPYTVDTRLSANAVVALKLSEKTKVAVSVSAEMAGEWYALQVDGVQVGSGMTVLIHEWPAGQVAVLPVANYDQYVGRPCKLAFSVVDDADIVSSITDLAVDTVKSLPFSASETAPQAVKYLYVMTMDGFDFYCPIAAKAFYYRAPKDLKYAITASDIICSLDAALTPVMENYGTPAVNKDVKADSVSTYVVRSTDGTFEFDMKEGELPAYQLNGTPEVTQVELPFRYEGTLSHACTGAWLGLKYDAYVFTLTKQARVRVYNSQSVYVYLSDSDGFGKGLSYGTSDVLEPGTYVVECYSASDEFAAVDYCLFIDTAAVASSDIPLYDTMPYDGSLTVGKTAYGTIVRTDGQFVQLGADSYATGFAKGFKVELEPGSYRAALTVSGDAGVGKGAVLAVYSQLTGTLTDDIVDFVADYVYDYQHQTSCSVAREFSVTKAGTYYVAIADWFDDCSNNYALSVEKFVPDHFTEITLPFAADDVLFDPTDAASYLGYFQTVGYAFLVPQDTLLKVSLQSDNGEFGAWITSSLNESSVADVYSGESYVSVPAGYWYMPIVEWRNQKATFSIALEYSDKQITTDTITLDSLLHAAKVVEAVENEALFLGSKPTELVEDIEGITRYAYAYNMALDSGECVRFTRTCNYDEYLFVYRATTDTFELWDKYDDSFPLIEANSTTNYYFVVSSFGECRMGNITLSLTKLAKDKIISVDSVLNHAIDITLPYHAEGEFSDASADYYEDSRYRQVYRVQLTEGSVAEFRMQAKNFSYNVDPRIEFYDADTNLVDLVDYGLTISYVYAVDSTAYYYVVLTTDDEGGEGTYLFDANAVQTTVTKDELVAAAMLLDQMRGTRTADKPQANGTEGSFDCWYNLALDSAQVFLFSFESMNNIGTFDVYKKVGETMTDVSCPWIAGNTWYLQADTVATYYLRISLASSFDSLTFDYKKTERLDQLPVQTVDSYLRLNGVFDTDNYHLMAIMDQPALTTDLYSVQRNAGEGLALMRRNTRGGLMVMISETMMSSDGVQNLPDASAAVTDSLILASDWNTTVYNRPDYDFLLHTTLSLDTILTHAPELDFATLPVSKNGTIDRLFAENAWYYNGSDNYAVFGAYKVDMKAGQTLQFTGSGNFEYMMEVYTYDGTAFNPVSYNSGFDMSFRASSADTYYIVLLTQLYDYSSVFDLLDGTYAYTLQNPMVLTEIVAVDVDCASVVTDDIESEVAARMALVELQLTMTAQNGAVINVANTSSAWVLDAELTTASYTVTLPEGYIFVEGVNPTVTVLVNPVTVDVQAGANGTVSPAGSKVVRRNSSMTLNIAANEGYVVDAVKVNGEPASCDVVGKSSGEFTFVANQNMAVEVTFRLSTAIDQVLTKQAVVYTQQRTLVIDGVEAGTDIRIYTVAGTLICADKATSTTQAYTMPTAGLYIVRIGLQIEKAICK
ncbi:MAG: hypothetical protein ACI30H_04185 [Paludibacteraceae bacterium]